VIRRALILLPLVARAQDGFPPRAPGGLELHGVAARRYLGFRVYEAALYLAAPAAVPEQVADPSLVLVRYLRRVVLADLRRAWLPSLGEPLNPGFDAWLRELSPGDEEHFAFTPAGARLEGPGRHALHLPPGPFTTMLRASWLGAEAPAALRQGWFRRPGRW